jgi:hypothetical protein
MPARPNRVVNHEPGVEDGKDDEADGTRNSRYLPRKVVPGLVGLDRPIDLARGCPSISSSTRPARPIDKEYQVRMNRSLSCLLCKPCQPTSDHPRLTYDVGGPSR